MENVFIEKIRFRVRTIKKCPEGWVLASARGNKETDEDRVVFISNQYYSGKIPPFFRWPWQKLYLEFEQVDGFILSARINDKVLFAVNPADFPPKIKAKLEKGEDILQEADVYFKRNEEDIKNALEAYLLKIPTSAFSEKELANLHICFRAYLKSRWEKGKKTPDFIRRFRLMVMLCRIAQRVNYRHFDFDAPLSESFLQMDVWSLLNREGRPNINFLRRYNTAVFKKMFDAYFEISGLIEADIPKVENGLLKCYLVYVIEELCLQFTADYAHFIVNTRQGDLNGNKTTSDTEIYKRCCNEAHLPYFTSFILP